MPVSSHPDFIIHSRVSPVWHSRLWAQLSSSSAAASIFQILFLPMLLVPMGLFMLCEDSRALGSHMRNLDMDGRIASLLACLALVIGCPIPFILGLRAMSSFADQTK